MSLISKSLATVATPALSPRRERDTTCATQRGYDPADLLPVDGNDSFARTAIYLGNRTPSLRRGLPSQKIPHVGYPIHIVRERSGNAVWESESETNTSMHRPQALFSI